MYWDDISLFSKLPRLPLWARDVATKYTIQWLNYTYPNSVFLSLGKEISPFFYLVFDMFWCGVPSLPPIYYYSKIYHFFLVSFSPFTCSNLFTVLPFEMYKHCTVDMVIFRSDDTPSGGCVRSDTFITIISDIYHTLMINIL